MRGRADILRDKLSLSPMMVILKPESDAGRIFRTRRISNSISISINWQRKSVRENTSLLIPIPVSALHHLSLRPLPILQSLAVLLGSIGNSQSRILE